MSGPVVGRDCETNQIVRFIIDNQLYLALFRDNWSDIARRLRIPSADISTVRNLIILSQFSPADVVDRIVELWVGTMSGDATLDALCQALIGSGVRNCADAIKRKFHEHANAVDASECVPESAQSPSDKITENLHHLIQLTELSPKMIAMFHTRRLLSDLDMATLSREWNEQKKIQRFYEIIQAREGFYEVLMQTLDATNQTNVADLLRM